MNLRGRRVHIAGSADVRTTAGLLNYAHSLTKELTILLARLGSTFLIDFGREPRSGEEGRGPAIVFYWTILEAVSSLMESGALASSGQGSLLLSLATSKTDTQIPQERRGLYSMLRQSGAVSMEFVAPGWNSGAVRRERQAQLGDILIAVSGGEGIEHLAREYSRRGKPVIPLDLNLGASTRDGTGGAARMFGEALVDSVPYFAIKVGQSGSELLDRTRTRQGQTPVHEVAASILRLLDAVTPPRAFYVRMLNKSLPQFDEVEAFFRSVVDPIAMEFGFEPLEIGIGENDYAWMNQAIFEGLYRSQVAIVDLTGVRANCLIELGYALGNAQRVIVTAQIGTLLPFDSSCLETYMWDMKSESATLQRELKTYWTRNFNRPPLVTPRGSR